MHLNRNRATPKRILLNFIVLVLVFFLHAEFIQARHLDLYLRVEPVVLGIYTQGNDVALYLCTSESTNTFQEIDLEIQFSNLSFKDCFPGTIYHGYEKPSVTVEKKDHQIHLRIQGTGKTSPLSNVQSISILIFEANSPGNARFWISQGTIKDTQDRRLPYHFLPSSIQIQHPQNKTIELQIGSRKYLSDSQRKTFALPPVIVQQRTFVPLRSIAEDMGANVEWIPKDSMILVQKKPLQIEMKIGKLMVVINGKTRYIDVPPLLYKNTTMIPLRYIAETLGGKVSWNAQGQRIKIDY
jgi:hypothetical protein